MKTVIISGSSRGIGAEVAKRFARDGFYVVVNYCTNKKAAEDTLALCGGNGCVYQADVKKYDEVEQMVDNLVRTKGRVDVVVCNAAVSFSGLLIDMTSQQIKEIVDTNLIGVINLIKAAARHMLSAQSGKIVNISSMWGQVGASCESVYSATKGGVIALTKALAKELGYNGINVNCIAPGLVDTDMNAALSKEDISQIVVETPCQRIGKASDIASVAAFLASEESNFINGQIIGVSGGFVI